MGSFLNVVIYRMPRAISIYKESRSFCPNCKHHLDVLDLFPLFSWLFSGRKCRHCGKPVSSRYFWVELFNALLWTGIWYQYLLGPTPDLGKAIAYALAGSALLAAFFIDLELYLIPDQICAFILFVGLGYNLWLYSQGLAHASMWGGVPSSVAGALVGSGIIAFIAIAGRVGFGKDAMGHGDIKLARGIGAILFPALAGVSFGLAVFLGAVFGVVQVLMRRSATASQEPAQEDEADAGPEPVGDLIKYSLSYILCFDVVGLFVPKFYKSFYGVDPYEPEEDLETFEAEATMIPFGPYLALGAILAVVFEKQLMGAVDAYLQSFKPPPAMFGLEFFRSLFYWNTFRP